MSCRSGSLKGTIVAAMLNLEVCPALRRSRRRALCGLFWVGFLWMDLNASASGYFGATWAHLSLRWFRVKYTFHNRTPVYSNRQSSNGPRPIWQHIRKPLSVADEADSAPAKRERESSKLTWKGEERDRGLIGWLDQPCDGKVQRSQRENWSSWASLPKRLNYEMRNGRNWVWQLLCQQKFYREQKLGPALPPNMHPPSRTCRQSWMDVITERPSSMHALTRWIHLPYAIAQDST